MSKDCPHPRQDLKAEVVDPDTKPLLPCASMTCAHGVGGKRGVGDIMVYDGADGPLQFKRVRHLDGSFLWSEYARKCEGPSCPTCGGSGIVRRTGGWATESLVVTTPCPGPDQRDYATVVMAFDD